MVDHSTVLIVFFSVFFGAAVLLALIVFTAQSRNEKSKREHELAMERLNMEKERARKEVLMVRCPYCGGMMPQAATSCPNCKAQRTA
jgi:rubrerythrin